MPKRKKKSTPKFAKKSLGQNFLQSTEIRDEILKKAGNITETNILEIGPGLGFLTTKLLTAKAHVTAVEMDPRAVEILTADFGHKPNFHLLLGDILQQNLDTLFPQKSYAVIANIPYNITGPILRKLLSQTQNQPTYAILMVQKEVAEKICNTQKRSLLSISVEIFAEAENFLFVGRENFSPAPKVDSAVIKLTIRSKPLIPPTLQKDFFRVVHAGFSEKRKKLGNVLPKFFGMSKSKLLGNIDPNRRAETLTVEEWESITHNFQFSYL
jgi:16S rRNA (adenine1518-N6/adenine1519-N6)-dimethyltransferase